MKRHARDCDQLRSWLRAATLGPWASLGRLCGLASVCMLVVVAGCDRLDMYDQPRYEPLEASDFFQDGLAARPLPEGTVARGELREDEAVYAGRVQGQLVSQIPEAAYLAVYHRNPGGFQQPYAQTGAAELRRGLLERGRERFHIYCSVCHGAAGYGDGMVIRRGFSKPPSYHSQRLRQAPAGHFFEVMTQGFGAMPSYASRVEVADRWAIVAYIRALQLSQMADLDDVPTDRRDALAQSPAADRGNDGEVSSDGASDGAADSRMPQPKEDVP